ncbi:hypothetical protein PR001_g25533 [Phytophthora rubi]|uniref:SET domain-containing protein n=2 Tax=Phytophthora rubi TaxID=129364 RepID=A0A6A3I7R5_9STRA|nr:hypothetical protein PR001_g25533 [Phytophthora rubi]
MAYRRSYIFRQSEKTLICEFAAGGVKSTAANTSKGAMVHLTHSTVHSRRRCINDTSSEDEENTPPNIQPSQQYDRGSKRRVEGVSDSASATGTATPPWLPPERSRPKPKAATNPPPSQEPTSAPVSPPMPCRPYASPTTSSPVLLETPPRSPARPRTHNALQLRHEGRRARREASAPYARRQSAPQHYARPVINPRGAMRVTADESPRAQLRGPRPRDQFIPAQWPHRVIHLCEQFDPLATVFPSVSHFGWCDCQSPCRVDSCRNSLMHLYCNINCCPHEGLCGNALAESSKVYPGRNVRTRSLGVVAGEGIEAGEVLGQYLGEMEHVSVSRAGRPRNSGYRLVMRQRPERPTFPDRVAINAENMGGLMRFVNHSCQPVAKFVEVANGRRTTVVVASMQDIHPSEEVTVDYGDDLWFACRCELDGCRHRNIQDAQDP